MLRNSSRAQRLAWPPADPGREPRKEDDLRAPIEQPGEGAPPGNDEAGGHPSRCPPATAAAVALDSPYVLNSGRRWANWAWRRATMLECIWLTRDSLRSRVAPISFMVMSS